MESTENLWPAWGKEQEARFGPTWKLFVSPVMLFTYEKFMEKNPKSFNTTVSIDIATHAITDNYGCLYFFVSEEDAIARAKEIVVRNPDKKFKVFALTHIVEREHPPVKVTKVNQTEIKS